MTDDLGVVIVTYNSSDVILDCLESLMASDGGSDLTIAVIDNASTDDTYAKILAWAAGDWEGQMTVDHPFQTTPVPKPIQVYEDRMKVGCINLIRADLNAGFASGVNIGLRHLSERPQLSRFWMLNPDCVVPPGTPMALAKLKGRFSVLGGRILYYDDPDVIQIDGGIVNKWTGVTGNINLGRKTGEAATPHQSDMDFISGASMVASREFLEANGPLPEDYFLYYEEVAWALGRGNLPLAYCPDATVYHRAGTSIGSPTLASGPSSFSAYFKHRARMMFVQRHNPMGLPTAYIYGIAKAAQATLKGQRELALSILRAIHGMSPTDEVNTRLSAQSRALLQSFRQ